jgi:hypothetical protein
MSCVEPKPFLRVQVLGLHPVLTNPGFRVSTKDEIVDGFPDFLFFAE